MLPSHLTRGMNRLHRPAIASTGIWLGISLAFGAATACSRAPESPSHNRPRAAQSPASSTSEAPTTTRVGASSPTTSSTTGPTSSSAVMAPSADTAASAASASPIEDCEHVDDSACCGDLDSAKQMAVGRSAAECKRIDRLRGYIDCPTAFVRGFHGVVQTCMQEAMLQAFRRHVAPLEADARTSEQTLQRDFEAATHASCSAIADKEGSASDYLGEHRCLLELWEWRTHQLELQDGAGWTTHHAARSPARAALFSRFAHALCANAAAFHGPAPRPCAERVLGELDDLLSAAERAARR